MSKLRNATHIDRAQQVVKAKFSLAKIIANDNYVH